MAECDLLVIGSGAAGLCAAATGAINGLDVIVAERAGVGRDDGVVGRLDVAAAQ
jgi:succinate dehydrogenase/fumarate reductase flavoprotein subunit